MRHVHTFPCEPQQFAFAHAGMKRCEHNRPQPIFTGLKEVVCLHLTREISYSYLRKVFAVEGTKEDGRLWEAFQEGDVNASATASLRLGRLRSSE